MPELPELEVTRRAIAPLMVGRTIRSVRTTKPSYFFLTPPGALAKRLAGRRVTALVRHGKYLLAELDDGSRLLLHLGMTGQLYSSGAASKRLPREPDAHTHLVIEFRDRGPALLFRDARKFGKVRWLRPGAREARLKKLGPDALEVSGALLFEATRKRAIPIKSLLLDQSVIAGVGNIYADEALFLARIRPMRRSSSLTRVECDRLARAIVRVLERGIATGGSSIDDFVRPDGSDGSYQDEHQVYGREGKPCPRCRAPIRRRVLGQRSSHFCASCQH